MNTSSVVPATTMLAPAAEKATLVISALSCVARPRSMRCNSLQRGRTAPTTLTTSCTTSVRVETDAIRSVCSQTATHSTGEPCAVMICSEYGRSVAS